MIVCTAHEQRLLLLTAVSLWLRWDFLFCFSTKTCQKSRLWLWLREGFDGSAASLRGKHKSGMELNVTLFSLRLCMPQKVGLTILLSCWLLLCYCPHWNMKRSKVPYHASFITFIFLEYAKFPIVCVPNDLKDCWDAHKIFSPLWLKQPVSASCWSWMFVDLRHVFFGGEGGRTRRQQRAESTSHCDYSVFVFFSWLAILSHRLSEEQSGWKAEDLEGKKKKKI